MRNKAPKNFVTLLGITVVALSIGIGYQAYVASRDALLQHVYSSNLGLARTLGDYATANRNASKSEVLADLKDLWKDRQKPSDGGFLCVVDHVGTLTLHTGAPDREGSYVGKNILHPNNPTTLETLVGQKQDYVGPYLSASGAQQVAAFSYVPSLDAVVSVHLPYQNIQARIDDTMLPWLVSLVLVGAVILPLSLWYLQRLNFQARAELRLTNESLRSEVQQRKQAEAELQTHKLNLEDEVSKRTDQLKVANNELEAFSYSVSHDLRSPLRGIDGFSLALLEDYDDALDEKGRYYLQRIRCGVQRLGVLIDELLKLSKVTRIDIQRRKTDLSQLVQEVFREQMEDQAERNINLTAQVGLTANCDENLIRVVLENLIGNAIKYTANTLRATIEIGTVAEHQESVFYIKDNGVGFDMRYVEKIFDPFQRLHNEKDFPGTGIGLATVERIINRHGGRIWAESDLNRGATFYFTLEESLPMNELVLTTAVNRVANLR